MPSDEHPTAKVAARSPLDPLRPGPLYLSGHRVRQCDGRSCGPAVIVVARAILDPSFAHELAVAAPDSLVEAQHAAHRSANVLWPRALGTTPWGLAAALTVHSGPYGWRPLRGSVRACVIDTVERGWPVPLLVGGRIPRHWVLLVGRDGPRVLCYEPTEGSVRAIAVDDLRAGLVSELGFATAQAVVLPRSVAAQAPGGPRGDTRGGTRGGPA